MEHLQQGGEVNDALIAEKGALQNNLHAELVKHVQLCSLLRHDILVCFTLFMCWYVEFAAGFLVVLMLLLN